MQALSQLSYGPQYPDRRDGVRREARKLVPLFTRIKPQRSAMRSAGAYSSQILVFTLGVFGKIITLIIVEQDRIVILVDRVFAVIFLKTIRNIIAETGTLIIVVFIIDHDVIAGFANFRRVVDFILESVSLDRLGLGRHVVIVNRLRRNFQLYGHQFGIELVDTLRTPRRAAAQIVKFGGTLWTSALGTQFMFGHDIPSQPVLFFGATRCHDHRALSKPDRRLLTLIVEIQLMTQLAPQLQGPFLARPSGPLTGTLAAPPDKSISHRALILAALAQGETKITGLLESADVLNTAKAVAALGAEVEHIGPGGWRVVGTGGRFATPDTPLDFGNSGTGVRLMMGAIAGSGAGAEFTGDSSLSSRPMRRVTDPLEMMGAHFSSTVGRLPATLAPSQLHGISYAPPIASAQVKSALLLAGLGASGDTIITEHHATRDHTETMLHAFGVTLDIARTGDGVRIRLPGPQSLKAQDITVPGDPSSIGFALVAALICPGSHIQIDGVMNNPSRTGLIETLREMGADLEIIPGVEMAGERTMNITARYCRLLGVDVPASRAPSMIDEYPVLGVAAAYAMGTTRMAGLAELRAKESDRLAGTAELLRRNGVELEVGEDSLTIHGKGPGSVAGGGMVLTHHDHRLAMSALVLGLAAQQPVSIDDASMIATSYPGFADDMTALGATLEPI